MAVLFSWFRFLGRAAANHRQVGAVAPSSRFLARAMCAPVDWANARVILELGPGTGVFTREILDRMRPDARLILVERDPVFAGHLRDAFPRADVVEGDIRDIAGILHARGVTAVDAVISGLPMLYIPRDILTTFFAAMPGVLPAAAPFLQFTYHPWKFRRLTTDWLERAETREFVLFNLPPATVLRLHLRRPPENPATDPHR